MARPTDRLFASDFAAFYYTFVIHPSFRRFYIQRYVMSTGQELFLEQRRASMGVKDSGTILGGHGGVLDRFDSLLFASLAGYFLTTWMVF